MGLLTTTYSDQRMSTAEEPTSGLAVCALLELLGLHALWLTCSAISASPLLCLKDGSSSPRLSLYGHWPQVKCLTCSSSPLGPLLSLVTSNVHSGNDPTPSKRKEPLDSLLIWKSGVPPLLFSSSKETCYAGFAPSRVSFALKQSLSLCLRSKLRLLHLRTAQSSKYRIARCWWWRG